MIDRINQLGIVDGRSTAFGQSDRVSEAKFLDLLMGLIEKVNEDSQVADELALKFVRGGDVEIHDLMIALEKADLSLKMLIQVRNKLIEAYQEVMRMQV